jgi:transcriptional regulator with XRE-family HTH domain
MDLVELGQSFRAARLHSRQTQKEISARTGVSVTTISQFENGLLTDLGTVRLVALLEQVGFELSARPGLQRRTLDDVAQELNAASANFNRDSQQQEAPVKQRQRVRKVKGA